MRALLLTTLAFAGCYNPQIPSGQYRCDSLTALCPDGQSCIDGWCRKPGDVPPADMAISAPVDAAAPDMAVNPWDPLRKPVIVSECNGGPGWRITDRLTLCQHRTTRGWAGNYCDMGRGWSPATVNPLSKTECENVPREWGTFSTAARMSGVALPPSPGMVAGWTGQAGPYRWLGMCGNLTQEKATYALAVPLDGWTRAFYVQTGVAGEPPATMSLPGQPPSDSYITNIQDFSEAAGAICVR